MHMAVSLLETAHRLNKEDSISLTMKRVDDDAIPLSHEGQIHRLEFTIDWPPGHAAAYLIDEPIPTIIDAGAPGECGHRELVDGLAAHGYTPSDVEHLLLTHPHSDHLGQARTIIEASDPVVYAPAGVRSRLNRSTTDLAAGVRETAHEAGLNGEGVEEAVEDACSSLRRNRQLLPPEAIDVEVRHAEQFTAGGLDFVAIHTPGHQADHACFLLAGNTVLFGGDMVIKPFRAATLDVGLDREAYDGITNYYTGYERLHRLNVDLVYPGHGPVFTTYEDALTRSQRDLDTMVREVFTALSASAPASPLAVTLAQLPNNPHHNRLRTTLLETVGALGYLKEVNRVTVERDNECVRQYRPVDGCGSE